MKRFILSLSAAAVLSMPMAASALDKMDNNQLKSATGQAGVSIAVDDVVIYQSSLADTTYWDTDGIQNSFNGETDEAAGIMIDQAESMEKLITIDAVLNADNYGVNTLASKFGLLNDGFKVSDDGTLQVEIVDDTDDSTSWENVADNGDTEYSDAFKEQIGILEKGQVGEELVEGLDASNGNLEGMVSGISPLTIDVGTCTALTTGWDYNTTDVITDEDDDDYDAKLAAASAKDVGGVVIGLPTVEITSYSTVDFKTIKLRNGTANADGTVTETVVADASGTPGDAQHFNAGKSFITIEKTGTSKLAILGGRLEIAPH